MTRQTTRLEVVADGAKWSVKEHGIGRLNSYGTELEATQAARAIGAQHAPCELIIRKADGSVETEHIHGR